MKSFLTSRSLQTTDVFGKRRSLEDLIACILRRPAREGRSVSLAASIRRGSRRPAGALRRVETDEDDDYAQERLEKAFHSAGFESVSFEMEPVAAAHYYESTLDHDELILIGDFGGGTSDFSLVRVGPSIRQPRPVAPRSAR